MISVSAPPRITSFTMSLCTAFCKGAAPVAAVRARDG